MLQESSRSSNHERGIAHPELWSWIRQPLTDWRLKEGAVEVTPNFSSSYSPIFCQWFTLPQFIWNQKARNPGNSLYRVQYPQTQRKIESRLGREANTERPAHSIRPSFIHILLSV